MSKIRFETDSGACLYSQGPLFPTFAIDTGRIVAYRFIKRGDLLLWFQGVADAVVVTYEAIGEDNFYALVKLLETEFTDVDKLKIVN